LDRRKAAPGESIAGMDILKEIGIYLLAVIDNWAGYCTGGVIVALLWFWSTLKQKISCASPKCHPGAKRGMVWDVVDSFL
jgi:hypothetical protein